MTCTTLTHKIGDTFALAGAFDWRDALGVPLDTTARCRNPFAIAASSACYVQGGEIIGEAPALTPVSIEI